MEEKETQVITWINQLSQYQSINVFNPWRDYNPELDLADDSYLVRQKQLRQYLLPRWGTAKYIIVAEAAGYQGARFTGIAITCERMLLGYHSVVQADAVFLGSKERTSNPDSSLLNKRQKEQGFLEPTDTVVWKALLENAVRPEEAILWNIFPFHPHKSGQPLTNRTPTKDELQVGLSYMGGLLQYHPKAQIIAVGRKAADTLQAAGYNVLVTRHPANGGARLYAEQFKKIIQGR